MGTIVIRDHQMQAIELVLNEAEGSHLSRLKSLLGDSERFVCMTAFARESGLKTIRKILRQRLAKGLKAFFVIGLDFFHTDPSVLDEMFGLSDKYALDLFVSRPSWERQGDAARNFHPKVFIIEGAETCVMIGSANLTGGGLIDNHESSVMIRDECGEISDQIQLQIQLLIKDKQIVSASRSLLNEYARRHAIYKVHERLTKWRIKRALESDDTEDLNLLRGYLAKMKADKAENGFDADVKYRKACLKRSKETLQAISNISDLTKSRFVQFYYPLVAELWHSGGLQRGKSLVANHAQGFKNALSSFAILRSPRIDQAFNALHEHLRNVKGAGINVLTEILHSFDDHRKRPDLAV
jgi:HKD family nuclease